MKNCSVEIVVRGPEGLIARRNFEMEESAARDFASELEVDGFEVRFERMLDSADGEEIPPTKPGEPAPLNEAGDQ